MLTMMMLVQLLVGFFHMSTMFDFMGRSRRRAFRAQKDMAPGTMTGNVFAISVADDDADEVDFDQSTSAVVHDSETSPIPGTCARGDISICKIYTSATYSFNEIERSRHTGCVPALKNTYTFSSVRRRTCVAVARTKSVAQLPMSLHASSSAVRTAGRPVTQSTCSEGVLGSALLGAGDAETADLGDVTPLMKAPRPPVDKGESDAFLGREKKFENDFAILRLWGTGGRSCAGGASMNGEVAVGDIGTKIELRGVDANGSSDKNEESRTMVDRLELESPVLGR
jgi:hypothetical protein